MDLRQAALVLLAGCAGGELGEPREPEAEAGKAVFEVHEAGGDLDLDGYQLVIDDGSPWTLPGNLPITLSDLSVGPHQVRLQGIEPNCVARSALTAHFTVVAGREASVEFAVDCVATGILVTLAGAGVDGPNEYPLIVDGVLRGWIHPNLAVRITRLPPGSREILLGTVPPNCSVAEPRSQPVDLAPGDLVPLAFGVTCVATTGVLRVRGEILGEDVDPNGYELNIDTSTRKDLGPLGDRIATLLVPSGAHIVELAGVAKNCLVNESGVRSVNVPGGGLARDTIDLIFGIRCQRAYHFAFVREEKLALGSEDGSFTEVAKAGEVPSWSPDGNSIAYACLGGICRLGLNGVRYPVLPALGPLRGIAWSRDGNRVAYAFDCLATPRDCQGGLALIHLEGSVETRISLPPAAWDLQGLSWSPDGSRIAFGCIDLSGSFGAICTIAPDGSNFTRLATDGGWNPSWSPDGSRILFTRWEGEIYSPYVMSADGSGLRAVKPGLSGQSGGWISNDRILVSDMACDSWYGCFSVGISSMRIDGADRIPLTIGQDVNPVWRP